MPFLLFFDIYMCRLLLSLETAFSCNGDLKVLRGFKARHARAKTDLDKRKVIKALTEHFNVALWIKDVNHVFLYVNEGCCLLILSSPMDNGVLFKMDDDFDRDSLSEFCMLGDIKVMKEDRPLRFIEHAVYPGQQHVWLDICKWPTHSPSGRVIGTIGFGVDLSLNVSDGTKERFRSPQSFEIDMDEVLISDRILGLLETTENERTGEPRQTI